MKTSPGDASNLEVIQEIRKLSGHVESLTGRMDALETGQSDILEAVQGLAEHTDERFLKIDERFSKIESQMVTKEMLRSTVQEVCQGEIGKLQTTMVTKGYLDDKLANLHSDVILQTRREISKAMG